MMYVDHMWTQGEALMPVKSINAILSLTPHGELNLLFKGGESSVVAFWKICGPSLMLKLK